MLKNYRQSLLRPYLSLFFLAMPLNAVSAENANDIFQMSLEELMTIKISTSSLSKSNFKGTASAVTLIRQEQIIYSPAKNLTALLEQYVPGLLVMAHSEGDKIGLRGHIAAENYKLLLLVNGKNITNMVYEGAITELDQWDLHDIEKIEVVRGPGSVTYGSGAIAGVINIITKSANDQAPHFNVNLSANDSYRSKGGSIQFKKTWDELSLYSFLSHRESDGLKNPDYFVLGYQENTDNRYLGQRPNDTLPAQDYLADTFSRPQIKAHFDLNYGENLNAWLRYTQSGQSHHFTNKNIVQANGNQERQNRRQVGLRSFIASVNHNYDLNASLNISNAFTYDNQEYIRWNHISNQSEWQHPNNIKDYAFSQERFTANSLFKYTGWAQFDVVTGIEYTKTLVRSPWHKSDDHIWIREGANLISNLNTSVYTQGASATPRLNESNSIEIGKGITTETYTHLLEASYKISDVNKITYSHRIDSPDIASTMYSPRLAWVNQLDSDNTLVVIAQRALRMMPLRAQHVYNLQNQGSRNTDHESIDGVEVSLNSKLLANTSINVRGYYNDIHAIGFTGGDLQFLSDYQLFGIDVELNYKKDNIDFVLNHAYIKPLDVEMNEALKNGSNKNNISFSDYNYQSRGDIPLSLESYGDGLNNIPENVTKLIVTAKFLDNTVVAQLSSQLYWGYDGSYDEMHMYQNAYDNVDTSTLSAQEHIIFQEQKRIFENERRLLDNNDAYKFDYNVNMSLTYHWQLDNDRLINWSLFIDNITRSKKLYYVSTGSSHAIPERLKYLEQPTTVGVNVSYSY
ncbi:TonB-dependent receptor plug domain-containing protein [Algibacillus agarilyticus]|uniref:TonB-dependent receptor plug domain-containing protein n=1 Tax=Algibacillus agarilyticus TaxID=2234133 RepID=UPI000DD0D685|nr:TonB-dependent receptor plug domain-containing protein [Algibacillus agarilyticus]